MSKSASSSFIINILFLIGVNLLVKPLYIFGIELGVQNAVGEQQYGLYLTLFNFAFLWQILNDFGLQNYNNKTVSQDNSKIHTLFPQLLTVKLLLVVMYTILVLVASWWAGYLEYLFPLLFLIMLNHVLGSLILFLRSNVSALGHYKVDSIFSSIDRLLLVLVAGYLLLSFRESFKIEWFVMAQSVTLSITALVVWLWLRNKAAIRFTLPKNWDWILDVLKNSYPYALVIFLMTLYTRLDTFMVEQLLEDGQRQVGIYGAGYRLLDAANMFGFLFATLLLPMFSRLLKPIQKEAISELLTTGIKMVWAAAIPLVIGVFTFRNQIMDVLYTEATPYYAQVMGVLIFNFVAMSGTYVFGTLLTANGDLKRMNILFAISILANILLNLWLIPRYGALGAAYSTLATQGFAFIAQVYLSKWAFNGSDFIRAFRQILLFSIFVIGIFYLVKTGASNINWLISFVGAGILSALAAFLFKMIDPNAVQEMIREKLRG